MKCGRSVVTLGFEFEFECEVEPEYDVGVGAEDDIGSRAKEKV